MQKQQPSNTTPDPSEQPKPMINEHLANERTFLAWIRTAIGVMAFGFVVVKFSLFIRQIAIVTGTQDELPRPGYSRPMGIGIVILGVASLLFGAWRYYRTAQQIQSSKYSHHSTILYTFVAFLLIIGALIVAYLIQTT